jgi:hypothetical protein
MYQKELARCGKLARLFALAVAFLATLPALAQANLRATEIGRTSVKLEWDAVSSAISYGISVDLRSVVHFSDTSVRSYTVTGLRPDTRYTLDLVWPGGSQGISVRTAGNGGADGDDADEQAEFAHRPPDVTCPDLPARVVLTGYAVNSQCQMVDDVVISGYPELQARGFIDAVDVYRYINGGIEICFRNAGWLVFLDAAYSPRQIVDQEQYQRDGMTCGNIDRAGTMVLLRDGPRTAGAPATLPVFDTIPLHDCHIKLVETLFLRATPAGEIIGLVWLNSEVPAFEINGYWYKVEFEGQTGYISRYHRKVLRGGCG